ncbi:MAG: hypothetical protein ACREXW_18740 [Gammaproteobacteria bacterium]
MQRSDSTPGSSRRHSASLQNRCNPLSQGDFKNGFADLCEARGVTYIAYSPVGGHFGHECLRNETFTLLTRPKYACAPQWIALAWLLHKGDHLLPIPGAGIPPLPTGGG